MKTKEEYSAHINGLLTSGKTLSLTDIMFCFYRKPCRCVFPGIGGGRIAEIHAQRGSVIVGEHEVVIVIDPTDTELVGPQEGESVSFECEEPTQYFQHGTTIIRRGTNSTHHITYYLVSDGAESRIKAFTLDQRKIWDRWAGHDFMGKRLLCDEHSGVMGARAASNMPRFLA